MRAQQNHSSRSNQYQHRRQKSIHAPTSLTNGKKTLPPLKRTFLCPLSKQTCSFLFQRLCLDPIREYYPSLTIICHLHQPSRPSRGKESPLSSASPSRLRDGDETSDQDSSVNADQPKKRAERLRRGRRAQSHCSRGDTSRGAEVELVQRLEASRGEKSSYGLKPQTSLQYILMQAQRSRVSAASRKIYELRADGVSVLARTCHLISLLGLPRSHPPQPPPPLRAVRHTYIIEIHTDTGRRFIILPPGGWSAVSLRCPSRKRGCTVRSRIKRNKGSIRMLLVAADKGPSRARRGITKLKVELSWGV